VSALLVAAAFLILFLAIAYGLFTRKGSGIDDHGGLGEEDTGGDAPPVTGHSGPSGESNPEGSSSRFDTHGTK
jgi:hypothetical protein